MIVLMLVLMYFVIVWQLMVKIVFIMGTHCCVLKLSQRYSLEMWQIKVYF